MGAGGRGGIGGKERARVICWQTQEEASAAGVGLKGSSPGVRLEISVEKQ